MKVTLYFTNLDNFMGTEQSASVTMDIAADDDTHATMLAVHLRNVLHADYYVIDHNTEYDNLVNGESVVIPKSREHAEAMVKVGMFYLETNK